MEFANITLLVKNPYQQLKEIIFEAVDIETTGLTPVVDRIVEIGAVKFRNGKVLGRFQELIDPEMPISPGAFAVNGIAAFKKISNC